MDIHKALTICLPMVAPKTKHRDYAHVVELTERLYRPMITGKGAEHLINQFNKREDMEAYQQRLRLTVLITPAISHTLLAPVRKIPKVKPVVNTATFGADKKKEDDMLNAAASTFYAGKSVDHFFGSVLLDQGAIDPNAFCLTLFDDFDERFQKPTVYPSLVGACDVWNFEYANGLLQWLWVHRNIKYHERRTTAPTRTKANRQPTGKKAETVVEADGHAFWMYTDQNHIMFTQVDKATVAAPVEGIIVDASGEPVADVNAVGLDTAGAYYYRANKDELYEVRFYEHKSGMVQAFRLGYIPDQQTFGRTMVNVWHSAVPYMLKGIKSGSELDLSASLHAFLQKISYENPCRGYTQEDGQTIDCNNGWEPGGKKRCRACGGTGWETHGSGQDHITFRLPRTKEEFFDLTQMIRYVELPVEVLEWQDKYVDKLERACYRAVYNSDRFRSGESSALSPSTATGDIIDLQSIYDAIKPAADWYSQNRVLEYKLIASLGSIGSAEDLQLAHAFPRNLRFDTMADRVALLKSLREAQARSSSIAQVNDDVDEDLYIDDPDALKQARVRARFDPFAGKSENAIVAMISQDNTTKRFKVYYTNEAYIFRKAVQEVANKQDSDGVAVNFYDMTEPEQEKIIDSILDDLMASVEEEASEAMERAKLGLAGDGGDTPTPDDTGEDLPNSPGQKATK